jgi:hypothetical protein
MEEHQCNSICKALGFESFGARAGSPSIQDDPNNSPSEGTSSKPESEESGSDSDSDEEVRSVVRGRRAAAAIKAKTKPLVSYLDSEP